MSLKDIADAMETAFGECKTTPWGDIAPPSKNAFDVGCSNNASWENCVVLL